MFKGTDRWRKIWSDFQNWTGRFTDRLAGFLLVLVAIALIFTGILYVSKIFWALYVETHVGQIYILQNESTVTLIQSILSLDPLSVTIGVIPLVLAKGLLLAAAARITFFARILYEGQGSILRLFLWGAMCAAWSASGLVATTALSFEVAFLLCLLPALALVNPVFSLIIWTIPESDDVFKWLRRKWRQQSSEF